MNTIARGFGLAAVDSLVRRMVRRFGNRIWVVIDRNDDSGARCYQQTTAELMHEIIGMGESEYVRKCNSDSDVASLFGDITESSVMLLEDFDRVERERDRQRLEKVAAAIARHHHVSVDSLAFIDAVCAAIEEHETRRKTFNSDESRHERYADYAYAGCRDEFFSDNDFENERAHRNIQDLYDILEWLAESCPLLWAQYREQFA